MMKLITVTLSQGHFTESQ